jgi:uncharacterized protein YndB with AHSA1/START domain
MVDIFEDFPVDASPARVFQAVSEPAELDCWWTLKCSGRAEPGASYELDFGPGYQWRAAVTRCVLNAEFELRITSADADWLGTRVGFTLEPKNGRTWVRFHHIGWPATNEHYRISVYCWAMYLRLMRRHIETGEIVPYEKRLDA